MVDFAPNALGQATQATSGTQNFATNATYFPNGALKKFTYGNGIVHTLVQNARGLPKTSTDAYGTTKYLADTYDYDPNGNVLAITDAATSRNQRGNRDMAYDGLDRLTRARSPMWGNFDANYAYDGIDNLIRATVPQTAMSAARDWHYCYDGANRLTNVKTGSCSGSTVIGLGYDVQGNVANKNGTTYAFDLGNRLRGTGAETYRYDAHGRRVRTTNTATGNLYRLYGRDGQLFWTRDERDNERRQFVYLAGSLVAEHMRPIGGSTETVTYQHTDALGSPVVRTSQTRSVLQRSEYEPYGKLANRANDDTPGYTGHVMDATSGLTYMQQRYYDPRVGRFWSVDPVTAYSDPVGQFNRYRYANNNPYKFTDPDGRCSEFINGLVGGLPCRFQQRNLNSAHVAADAVAAGNARMLLGYQGDIAISAVGGGAIWHGGKLVLKSKEVQLAVCLGASLCSAKDFKGVLQRIQDFGDVAYDLRRRATTITRAVERRTPSQQRPTTPARTSGAGGSSDAAGANAARHSGGSGGFQGVFRVDGRLDSRRLADELKDK